MHTLYTMGSFLKTLSPEVMVVWSSCCTNCDIGGTLAEGEGFKELSDKLKKQMRYEKWIYRNMFSRRNNVTLISE